MALFSFGKDKKEEGNSDLVLAYLEDAQRLRLVFTLKDPKGREVNGTLQTIDEGAGRIGFQLNGPLMAEKGDKVRVQFLLGELRLEAQGRVAETRSGGLSLELPGSLELQERRKKPRARLNPREGATLTALSSLFEGVGISGVVESISEGGARVKVERALEAKGERKLHIGVGLFPIGHTFMIVKISKLPRTVSTLELSGRVAYLDASSGLSVGIAFTDPPSELTNVIKNVVSAKGGSLPTSIPPKSRRPKEAPAAPAPPEAKAATEPAAEETPPPAAAPPPPPPAEPAPERSNALVRMKKRARILLLAMASSPGRDLLAQFLTEDGFGRVLTASTLTELLKQLQENTVALVFIDGGVAELQGLDLAEALQKVGEAHIPLILAAEEVSTATVLAARRAGVDQVVVKPYLLDETLISLLEQQLGIA